MVWLFWTCLISATLLQIPGKKLLVIPQFSSVSREIDILDIMWNAISVSALWYIDKSWLVYKRLVLSLSITTNETLKLKFSIVVFALSLLQPGYVSCRTGFVCPDRDNKMSFWIWRLKSHQQSGPYKVKTSVSFRPLPLLIT